MLWTGQEEVLKRKGGEIVLAGAGSSASSVFTAMTGGTGISARPENRFGLVGRGRGVEDRGACTVGREFVTHPLLIDDFGEDAQAKALVLLQPAHLLLGCVGSSTLP
jgi:hypothetical protein